MTKPKAALFDVDGVLIVPPRSFAEVYCEAYGVNLGQLEPFYKTAEFQNSLIGQMDLKDAIAAHGDKWHWEGDVGELIQQWLEAENYPNRELLDMVDDLRASGTKVYIVTAQEKYRADFLRQQVFAGHYDGFLATCDIGWHKHSEEFWREVIRRVGEDPAEMVYFDDRANLVELAASFGIQAFVYASIEDVRHALA